jgi:hypothetical protein
MLDIIFAATVRAVWPQILASVANRRYARLEFRGYKDSSFSIVQGPNLQGPELR